MFSNIAIAFLVSLGIAVVLFLLVKGLYSGFSPEALHLLVAIAVIVGSTIALTVAITSGKALKYVAYLEDGAKTLTGQIDDVQNAYGLDSYGISASDLAGGYVDGAASLAKSRLSRTRTLSYIVAAVLNVLLALLLFNAGGKARCYNRSRSYDDGDDDLDSYGGSSTFSNLDLD